MKNYRGETYARQRGKNSMAAKRTRKRKTSDKKSQAKQKDFEAFYKEIAVLIMFALFLFLFLSNFGWCGDIGDTISSVLFGVFGTVQYVIPLVGLLLSLLLISNDFSSLSMKKCVFSILLLCMIATVFQMFHCITLTDFGKAFINGSKYREGGGVIGTGICSIFYKETGIAGTTVVVLLISIISIILITERSLFSFLRKARKLALFLKVVCDRQTQKLREDFVKRREIAAEQRKQKEEKPKKSMAKGRTKLQGRKKQRKTKQEPQNVGKLEFPDFDLGRPRPADAQPMKRQHTKPETEFDFSLPEEEEKLFEPKVSDAIIPSGMEPERKRKTRAEKTSVTKVQNTGSAKKDGTYVFPPTSLLHKGKNTGGTNQKELKQTALKLQQTLKDFGVNVTITDISCGPSVTRFELHPEQGVKVSKIVGLADDIKLSLAASDIRMEAPIPGKSAIGIEVPNKTNEMVMFRELIENDEFKNYPSNIAFAVGKNLAGQVIVSDIAKMPHLLIAGATGSGKSVCINTLIMSILYKSKPEDVKLIMIDPKVVELSAYQGIPHLLIPVVTDPKQASSALNWAVMEMGERYKKFAEVNVRNLKGYNDKVEESIKNGIEGEDFQKLPQIIIIIDELADLMMVAPSEVEDAIVRLSQLARAAGIHLVIATQRPSVNVITGLIKANVPSRIAFSVSSGVDSRTIIDMNGAEKLLGKGDMLFYPSGYQKPIRVQGAFISDEEVSDVVSFLKEHNSVQEEKGVYGSDIQEKIQTAAVKAASSAERDEYFEDAAKFIIDKDKASIASLQRVFKIGFNRAARLMDQLCEAGIVGEEEGTKPRKVLMSQEEFEQYKEEYL